MCQTVDLLQSAIEGAFRFLGLFLPGGHLSAFVEQVARISLMICCSSALTAFLVAASPRVYFSASTCCSNVARTRSFQWASVLRFFYWA